MGDTSECESRSAVISVSELKEIDGSRDGPSFLLLSIGPTGFGLWRLKHIRRFAVDKHAGLQDAGLSSSAAQPS